VPVSGEYVLGQPLVTKATVTFPNGTKLTINAPQSGRPGGHSPYATLRSGQPMTRVKHQDLVQGGELRFASAKAPH